MPPKKLTPSQIEQYNASQQGAAAPLSPDAWLKSQAAGPPAFTTQNLAPATSVKVPAVPAVTSPEEMTGAISGGADSLSEILKGLQAPAPAERNQDVLRKDILSTLETLSGKSSRVAQLEEQKGVNAMSTQLQDVVGQLQGLQKEALAIPLQIQEESVGRGVTRGGVEPIQAGRLRQNAIKSLTLSAIGQTLQGNISLAQSQVQRAVDLEFEPQEKRLDYLKQLYAFNSEDLNRQDKKKADALKIMIDERSRLLDVEKANKNEIYNIGLIAQKFGAPTGTVQKIMAAKTREEALIAAGSSLVDPKAKLELEGARLDNILKNKEIAYKSKQLQLLGEPTKEEVKATTAALKEAEASIPVMQDKITAVDTLVSHPGLGVRVGPNRLSRQGYLVGIPGVFGFGSSVPTMISEARGEGQAFAGGIHKLTAGLAIDKLLEAKERGATFGALSDSELRLLANAATALNDWEVKDDKDKGTGYWDIDEESFKKEIGTIKELTQRALIKANGKVLTKDENAVLDSLYQVTSEDAPASAYFK